MGTQPSVRILIVDDNLDHVQLALRALRAEPSWQVEAVRLASECLVRLKEEDIDLVLLDYRLPDMTGLDVLRLMEQGARRPAVLLMTSQGSEEVAIEALKAGAVGYVVKNTDFGRRLAYEVREWVAGRKESPS